jgi:hypothetical protein
VLTAGGVVAVLASCDEAVPQARSHTRAPGVAAVEASREGAASRLSELVRPGVL